MQLPHLLVPVKNEPVFEAPYMYIWASCLNILERPLSVALAAQIRGQLINKYVILCPIKATLIYMTAVNAHPPTHISTKKERSIHSSI